MDTFGSTASSHVWATKYQYKERGVLYDKTVEDMWRRIARALSAVEPLNRAYWEQQFLQLLSGFTFLPGGRIQAGAGIERNVTLFNCFVMGMIDDSLDGIFRALKEGAMTMQQGGGIGYDFSTLRPRGAWAKGVGALASGPVSFMRVWDAMCDTVLSTGARRGAMMATLHCDHPDIEEFITAKQHPGVLRHFNLSVQVTDAFMAAVRQDAEWPLVFPAAALDTAGQTVERSWPGYATPVPCLVLKTVRASALWEKMLRATYAYAEPGVLFIDRINRLNNLWYCEQISATNPCGEIPLPPYGACTLGSLNLTRFVRDPFTAHATCDTAALTAVVPVAVRLLDNVIDASRFPLEQQAQMAWGSRRIGLGMTGLADMLMMLGIPYNSERAIQFAADLMRTICYTAYRASMALATEKGCFPFFEHDKYLQGAFIQSLPVDIRSEMARTGMRNSHLLAIAPTGTISLLANNVSSGLEPVFAASYTRRLRHEDGTVRTFTLVDYAVQRWRELTGQHTGVPEAFVSAEQLPVQAHLQMQAALQAYVDNAISKTIHVPEHYPFAEFQQIYGLAYDLGLKGCTTFRPNPITGSVLQGAEESVNARHCCSLEREAD
jgi:ribonucleoside-diphosphate reductase alpha chain